MPVAMQATATSRVASDDSDSRCSAVARIPVTGCPAKCSGVHTIEWVTAQVATVVLAPTSRNRRHPVGRNPSGNANGTWAISRPCDTIHPDAPTWRIARASVSRSGVWTIIQEMTGTVAKVLHAMAPDAIISQPSGWRGRRHATNPPTNTPLTPMAN